MIAAGPSRGGGLGIAGITACNGGARSSPFGLGVPDDHLPGPGSRLFFFGLLVAAAAMLGLSGMAAGLGRRFRRHPATPAAAHGLPPAGMRPAGRPTAGDITRLIPISPSSPRKGDVSCPSPSALPSLPSGRSSPSP